MAKLRNTHRTLRIVLCSTLGAVVAVGGTIGIIALTGNLVPNEVPVTFENTKIAVPEGVTPSVAAADDELSANTLYYLAYQLDTQEYYSVEAVNASSSLGIKSTTHTYKDYAEGVMIATDITTGITKSASQTCYAADADGNLVAYRRTGSASSSSVTVNDVKWDDDYADTYYYYRDDYRLVYGEYSTEMTVYLLNSDTLSECGDITDNGDGTYSQSFTLSSSAGYYYQYAMCTNGGLDGLPSFNSIEMKVTFDGDWRVLEVYVEEETTVEMFGTFNTSATTTTTFSYGESSINTDNFSYYQSYYVDAIPNTTEGGSTVASESSTDVLTLLQSAFADVLSGGDQYAFTLDSGENTYYGLIYLSVDMGTVASDTANAIEARILLSSDKNYDTQDLYIEYSGGEVSAYYSTDFAMKADVSDISDAVNDIADWIDGYTIGSSNANTARYAATKAKAAEDSFSLESLLSSLKTTENADGTVTVSLSLDISGICAYVQLDFSVTETESKTTYSLISGYIGDVSYNGEDVELSLTLTDTSEAAISRDSSQTIYDLALAADSIYGLLESDVLSLGLNIDGDSLYTLVNALTDDAYADYLSILNNTDIQLTALADIDGVVVGVRLAVLQDGDTLIGMDVYYNYGGTGYGTAYISVTEFMGADTEFYIYCDIADLETGIKALIEAVEGYTKTELPEEQTASYSLTASGGTDDSLSVISIINSILGMNFGSLISEIKTNGNLLSVTLNADYLLEALGISLGVELGDVALGYAYNTDGTSGGTLTAALSDLGVNASLRGADGTITKPDSAVYLDLTAFTQSLTKAISGNSVAMDLELSGYKTGTALDGYTVAMSTYVDPSSDSVALYADFDITMDATEEDPAVTVLVFSVYYAYDGTTQSYGKVYLSLTNILGVECNINLYCDISEVASNITSLINAINEYNSTGGEQKQSGDSSLDTDAIIEVIADLIGDEKGFVSGIASGVTALITDGIDVNTLVSGLINNIDGIVKYIGANNSLAVVTVDTDVLLSVISSSLAKGLSLNDLTVTYSLDCDRQDSVTGGGCLTVDWDNRLGMYVYGSAVEVSSREPDYADYIDLNDLVTTVQSAFKVAKAIAANGAHFTIDGNVEVDDKAITAKGEGEVCLTNGSVSTVAVDVNLYVDDATSGDKESLSVQIVYIAANANNTAEDPFLYVVINGEGMAVLYSEYSTFTSKITEIVDIIDGLISSDGEEGTDTNNIQTAALTETSSGSVDILTILKYVLSTVADREFITQLSNLSDTFSDFSVNVTDGEVSINYDNGGEISDVLTVTVSQADGYMSLTTDIMGIGAYVYASDGKDGVANTLLAKFDDDGYDLTKNLSAMVYKVYGFIFDYLDTADLSALFNGSASVLQFTLDGDSSGIKSLEGIYVTATATAGTISGNGIYSVSADIDISGFTVKASIVYYADTIYVEITDIGGTEFEDLKIKSSTDDIYSLVENVVKIIMDEDILSVVKSAMGMTTESGSDDNSGDNSGVSTASLSLTAEEEEETASSLTSVFNMLNALLGGIVCVSETEGGYTAIVDMDSILKSLGVTETVGDLTANAITDNNSNLTGVEAYLTAETLDEDNNKVTNKWIYLYAGAGKAAYTAVDSTTETGSNEATLYTKSYADIGFTSQLINDIATFAKSGIQTEDEQVTGVEYTFTGSISVPISVSVSDYTISGTIDITDIELTIGYKADGEFYFDMFGYIKESSVDVVSSIISVTIAKANYIGISYSSKATTVDGDDLGLITLARGLNYDGSASDDTIYWIMTLDYFIDNLFATHSDSDGTDSPIRWLLQMGSFLTFDIWNLVVDNAGLTLSSGLDDPETLYMYTTTSNSDSDSISIFESYISYFAAMFNSSSYTMGDSSDGSEMADTLSLSNYENGYYALSLGDGLLGSTFSPIYAAITRSGDSKGLGHILAYMNIAGYVEVNVDLEYTGSSPAKNTDYFDVATGVASKEIDWVNGKGTKAEYDYEYYKFGSVHIAADGVLTYSDSRCLVDGYVTVTVWEWNSDNNEYVEGAVYELRYGATIYLYTLSSDGIVTTGSNAVVYTTGTYFDSATGSLAFDTTTGEYYSDSDLPTSITVTGNVDLYEYTTDTKVYTLTLNMIDGTGEIIKTVEYKVFEGADLPTDVYSGYTLLDNTWYTDEDLTVDANVGTDGVTDNMTLYGQFAKNSVTVNGVIYTFTNSDTYTINSSNSSNTEFTSTTINVEGGYYSITGYTNLSKYNSGSNWLILEDEIDGYKVLEIQAEKFKDCTFVNVVVPENIIYIGQSAFTDNTHLANVVFLADTVYFDNGGDITNYPFRGCTYNNVNVSVYVKGYVALGEDSSSKYYYAFAVNATSDQIDTESRRANAYVNTADTTAWLYFKVGELDRAGEYTSEDIESDMIDYLYGSGYCDVYLYAATQYMLINLTANSLDQETLASDLSYYLENAVNEYTAEKLGYINAYEVTATITGSDISVNVKQRATSDYYYRVDITNYLGDEADASTTYTVNYSGDYKQFGEDMYFNSGESITLSGGTYGYTLDRISYSGTYDGLTLTAAEDGTSTLSLYWTKIEIENGIKVTSAIPFYYNGDTEYTLNADTEYTVAPDSDGYLADLTATQSGVYFLGWAYVNGDNLVFTTMPSETTVTYYAIWAYSSEKIAGYTVNDGESKLSTSVTLADAVSGASFYDWYTDGDFSETVSEISVSQTVVYARMQYTLYYHFALDNYSDKRYYTTTNSYTSSSYGELTATVCEGNYILITPDSSFTQNNKSTCGFDIYIYDSYSAYGKDSNSYKQSFALCVYKTTTFITTYVSGGYDTCSFMNTWDYTDYSSTYSNQSYTTYYDSETFAKFASASKWIAGEEGAYYIYSAGHSTTISLRY